MIGWDLPHMKTTSDYKAMYFPIYCYVYAVHKNKRKYWIKTIVYDRYREARKYVYLEYREASKT